MATHSDSTPEPQHVEPEHQEAVQDASDQVTARLNVEEQQRTEQSRGRRDSRGRFASSTDNTQNTGSAPTSWSPDAKAAFNDLPQSVRDAIAKREGEMASGAQLHSGERQRWRDIDQVMAPRRETLTRMGMSEAQAIGHLFAVSDQLERDPVGTMKAYVNSLPPAQAAQIRQALGGGGGYTQQQVEAIIQQDRAQRQYSPEQLETIRAHVAEARADERRKVMAEYARLNNKRAAANASLNGAPHGIPATPSRGRATSQFGDVADDVRAAVGSLM